ncbi:MAG: DUF4105 domain-containing protein [Paludibacteraceae bacterium]|nr:DUF4105 domain-containing protein [Paludibacteraceae bacterium]
MRKFLLAILLLLTASLHAQSLSDKAYISILTCAPGDELYARYGHTAIRLVDPVNHLDLAFNYGVFDFYTDNFYWKFVKGDTWYELGLEPTEFFFDDYDETRPIYEQILNLTPEQLNNFVLALRTNYMPENRSYLYNFVFDNCATRPLNLIRNIYGDSLSSSYTGHQGETYRQYIRRYTGRGSWADFGINLIFGRRAMHHMQGDEALFLPEELMNFLQSATTSDGQPIVKPGQNIGTFAPRHTPWYATWYFGMGIALLLVIAISWLGQHFNHRNRWLDIIFACIYGILFLIVVFLRFFSVHPLVGFGWRLFLIPIIYLCIRYIFRVK